MKRKENKQCRNIMMESLRKAQKIFLENGFNSFYEINTPISLGKRQIWHLKEHLYSQLGMSRSIDVVALVKVFPPGASPHYHTEVDTSFLPVDFNKCSGNFFILGMPEQALYQIPMNINEMVFAERGLAHGLSVCEPVLYLTAHIGKVLRWDGNHDVVEVSDYTTFNPLVRV